MSDKKKAYAVFVSNGLHMLVSIISHLNAHLCPMALAPTHPTSMYIFIYAYVYVSMYMFLLFCFFGFLYLSTTIYYYTARYYTV